MNINARKFWWVNHNNTGKISIRDQYLWCPKKKSNGDNNIFYSNMCKASVGDYVFSFFESKIQALGIVIDSVVDCPEPNEFKDNKHNWERDGWKLPVIFIKLPESLSIKEKLDVNSVDYEYSPLNKKINAKEGAYFSFVEENLAEELKKIIPHFNHIIRELDNIKLPEERSPEEDYENFITSQRREINSRRGQDKFKENVLKIETRCRITGIGNVNFLNASHIKPWRDCNDQERLDGNNGLLLAPHIDKLFDQGFISFEDSGDLIISSTLPEDILSKWYIPNSLNVGRFSDLQAKYLSYHRKKIFKK